MTHNYVPHDGPFGAFGAFSLVEFSNGQRITLNDLALFSRAHADLEDCARVDAGNGPEWSRADCTSRACLRLFVANRQDAGRFPGALVESDDRVYDLAQFIIACYWMLDPAGLLWPFDDDGVLLPEHGPFLEVA